VNPRSVSHPQSHYRAEAGDGSLGGSQNHKENTMKRRNAVALFLCVCVILAILLLTQVVSSIVGAIVFAVALVLFGSLSKGFRGNDLSSKSK
jgi:hypothetical protein